MIPTLLSSPRVARCAAAATFLAISAIAGAQGVAPPKPGASAPAASQTTASVRSAPSSNNVVAIDPQPVKPAGELGLYTAAEAKRYGLCKLIRGTRQEVAEAYQLPPSSLREDPLEGRTPEVWKIDVRGPVTRALDETLRRRIDRAVRRGANMVILQLETAGGYRFPASQTPWQDLQRSRVGDLSTGAILEGAEAFQRIDRLHGVPRDNH